MVYCSNKFIIPPTLRELSLLAVQDSSIGDLVTQSVTHLLISEHYRDVVDNATMTMTISTITTIATIATITTVTLQ